jgi:hypothetical protein
MHAHSSFYILVSGIKFFSMSQGRGIPFEPLGILTGVNGTGGKKPFHHGLFPMTDQTHEQHRDKAEPIFTGLNTEIQGLFSLVHGKQTVLDRHQLNNFRVFMVMVVIVIVITTMVTHDL